MRKFDYISNFNWYISEVVNIRKPPITYDNRLFLVDALDTIGQGLYGTKWTGKERIALTPDEARGCRQLCDEENFPYPETIVNPDQEGRERFEDVAKLLLSWLANGKLKASTRAIDADRWVASPTWEDVPQAFWETRDIWHKEITVGRAYNSEENGEFWRLWIFVHERALGSLFAGERHRRGIGPPTRTGAAGRSSGAYLVKEEFERMIKNGQIKNSIKENGETLATWYIRNRYSPPLSNRTIENVIRDRHNGLKTSKQP